MPLLSSKQLQSLKKEISPSPKSEEESLTSLLEKKGLSKEQILQRLEYEMSCAEQPAVRVRAAETGLKLHGLLQKDSEVGNSVHVNIVIQDSQFGSINPILIPR